MSTTDVIGPLRIVSEWEALLSTSLKDNALATWNLYLSTIDLKHALAAVDDCVNTYMAKSERSTSAVAKPTLAHFKAAYKRRAFGSSVEESAGITPEGCSSCTFTGWRAIVLCGNGNWGEPPCTILKLKYARQDLEAKRYQFYRHYWKHLVPCGCALGKVAQRHTSFSNERLRDLQPWTFTWANAENVVVQFQERSDHVHYGTPIPEEKPVDTQLQRELKAIIANVHSATGEVDYAKERAKREQERSIKESANEKGE